MTFISLPSTVTSWFEMLIKSSSEDVKILDIEGYEDLQIQYVWFMSSKKRYSKLIDDYITKLKDELNVND